MLTDDGMQYLRKFTQLQGLDLGGPKMTDAGLVHFRGLTIQDLVLAGDQITDAGLQHFAGLDKLIKAKLSSPQITDAGISQLKKTRPYIHIER